jgi:biopolymer transport protein ExbD
MKNWVNIKKPEVKKARIEIIPMIDTIFFLLVYFMFVSLSMVSMKGMGVSLPKNSDTMSLKPPPNIVVTVDPSGAYFVDRKQVTLDGLEGALQNQLNIQPNGIIIVNVDKHKTTQILVSVLDAVNSVTIPGSGDTPPVAIASQGLNPDGSPIQ